MAPSRSVRPLPGFSRFSRESTALGATGVPVTGTRPSGIILQDGSGFDWYMWFDLNGTLRFANAVTVETPGFNFATGGQAAGQFSITVPLVAGSVDSDAWVAPVGAVLVSIAETHSVVGGAAAAVRPRKITDTSAPGAAASGTVIELTTANIDLTASINTVRNPALSAVAGALVFAAGNRLALDFSGTLTGLVGFATFNFAQVG